MALRTDLISAPRWLTAGVALIASLGCESMDSSDVSTSDINTDITVTATGAGESLVVAKLYSGSHALQLTGGDQLVATAGREREIMSEHGDDGHYWYDATFDLDDMGTEFTVALERPSDHGESATRSTVVMPPKFQIVSPARFQVFSASRDAIEVVWSRQTGDTLEINTRGDCVDSVDERLSRDTGSWRIAPRTFELDEDDSCKLTIELTRVRVGQLDPMLTEGGRIVAVQTREVEIFLVP